MRRALIIVTVLAASLACAAPALASPPATGTKAPVAGNSHPIPRTYVGLAQIGPRGFCDTAEETGSGAGLCADVTPDPIFSRMWVRSGASGWKKGKAISNHAPDYFFVTPYAPGWHWVVSLRYGVVVMRTASLSLMSPNHF